MAAGFIDLASIPVEVLPRHFHSLQSRACARPIWRGIQERGARCGGGFAEAISATCCRGGDFAISRRGDRRCSPRSAWLRHGARARRARRRTEARGRLSNQRARRDPARPRERQHIVREKLRAARRAGEPRQADDAGISVQRDQARPRQARRHLHHQRKRLAQGRSAVARLDHVCGHPQQDRRVGPDPGHHRQFRQRRLHRGCRSAGRQRNRVRRSS